MPRSTPVILSFHRYSLGTARFAVNVKVHTYFSDFGRLSDADAEMAEESAREAFWRDLNEIAADIFGAGSAVYSEGRSGGWAVPVGPDGKGFTPERIEDDADLRLRCDSFARKAERMLADLVPGYVRPAVADRLAAIREARREAREAYKAERMAYHARAAALALLIFTLESAPNMDGLPAVVRSHLRDAGLAEDTPRAVALYLYDLIGEEPTPPRRR